MSKTRYVAMDKNALAAMLESLEYKYVDNATFQSAIEQYKKYNNIQPLAKLLSSYELEFGRIAINYHDEIIPAQGEALKNLSLFNSSPSPIDVADNSELSPEEVLKILNFN